MPIVDTSLAGINGENFIRLHSDDDSAYQMAIRETISLIDFYTLLWYE